MWKGRGRGSTRRAQYSLIEEYTKNCVRDQYVLGIYLNSAILGSRGMCKFTLMKGVLSSDASGRTARTGAIMKTDVDSETMLRMLGCCFRLSYHSSETISFTIYDPGAAGPPFPPMVPPTCQSGCGGNGFIHHLWCGCGGGNGFIHHL